MHEGAADLAALVELATTDAELVGQWLEVLLRFEAQLDELEWLAGLEGTVDFESAFVHIERATAQLDSFDIVALFRDLYTRWAERHGFSCVIVHEQLGQHAELHQTVLHIQGPFVFGRLRGETGLHLTARRTQHDGRDHRVREAALIGIIPDITNPSLAAWREQDVQMDLIRHLDRTRRHT